MLAFPDASALGLAEAPVPLPYHGPSSSPRLHQHRHQQHGKADAARHGQHFGGVHSHQQRKSSSVAAWAGALGKGRSGTHVCSALGFSRGSSGFEEEAEPSSQFEECRRQMAQYVRTVDTEAAHQFVEQANSTVVIAMKQTVANLVGTLPPQYFDVKISTVAESLAQLFLTVMTTGYMFRSAQYRMELSSSLSPSSGSFGRSSSAAGAIAAGTGSSSSSLGTLGTHGTSSSTSTGSGLFSSGASDDDTASTLRCVTAATSSGGGGSSSTTSLALSTSYGFLELESQLYAPGVQKSKVEGEVMRWHLERGLERMPAVDYISALEAQVSSLRRELAQRDRPAGGTATMTLGAAPVAGSGLGVLLGPAPGCGARNDLLEYVKGLDPRSIKELTAGAGSEHVKEAMQLFIARLLGISDKEQLRSMSSEFTSAELSQVLFWLMVVGYTLRTMEVRSDLSDSLDL